MIWQITCYNGTIWKAPYGVILTDAIELFMKDTHMSQMDIKYIQNLH